MREPRKRKTQYERGREETGKNLLLLLLTMLDSYPNAPSPVTVGMLEAGLDQKISGLLSEAIDRFAKRLSRESRKRPEVVA